MIRFELEEETAEYNVRNRDVGPVVEMARRAMARGQLAEVGAFLCIYQEFNTEYVLDEIIAEMQAWVSEHLGGKVVSAAAAPVATNAVAACFEEGLLDREKPFQLCFLLLAMRARRLWMGVEIPAFVEMVWEQYPKLEKFYGKKKEQIVWSIKNLMNKATHNFYERVQDQFSMRVFIDELHRLKKDGTRRKDAKEAQSLAETLFLRF